MPANEQRLRLTAQYPGCTGRIIAHEFFPFDDRDLQPIVFLDDPFVDITRIDRPAQAPLLHIGHWIAQISCLDGEFGDAVYMPRGRTPIVLLEYGLLAKPHFGPLLFLYSWRAIRG